ncbi:MAG: sodium:calcium antiporter [Patescibacteria group bacterium]
MYELYFNILLIAVGIFALIKSGAYVVKALINIAHFLKISEFTLSFILMAAATSLPELGIGLNAAFNNTPLISLGNILGANILVLSLILGAMILIEGNLTLKKHSPAHSSWFNFFLAISPVILLIDGDLSRFDGLILIALFVLNLGRLLKFREIFNHHRVKHFLNGDEHRLADLNTSFFLKNLFIFILAIGVLLLSSYLIVKGVEIFSLKLGIPEILIGIFIVALSTTLPELSFGIKAILSRRNEMSLGNLLGTVVFNSTLILGIVSLISPIRIENGVSFWVSAGVMILIIFLANLFLKTRDSLNRLEGLLLILIYFVFAIISYVLALPKIPV